MQATPVDRPTYQEWEIYAKAPQEVQRTMDAIHLAVKPYTSPLYGLGRLHDLDAWEFNFYWHDGASYRIQITAAGELSRLFRVQYTGAMVDDGEEGLVPDFEWRTVRAFAKDRAGKILARSMTLGGRPATKSWTEASAR